MVTADPLRPLKTVTRVLSWLVTLALIAAVIVDLAILGWLPGSSDDQSLCVETGNWVSAPGISVPPLLVKAGVQPSVSVTGLCVEAPSTAQRITDVGLQLPSMIFVAGALLLLLRFLRIASEEGSYSSIVADKLRILGWYLIVVGPACALLSALASFALRTSMIASLPALSWLSDWFDNIPWWAIITGAAALTFARILRIGVRMSEDLVGTV